MSIRYHQSEKLKKLNHLHLLSFKILHLLLSLNFKVKGLRTFTIQTESSMSQIKEELAEIRQSVDSQSTPRTPELRQWPLRDQLTKSSTLHLTFKLTRTLWSSPTQKDQTTSSKIKLFSTQWHLALSTKSQELTPSKILPDHLRNGATGPLPKNRNDRA